jgi:anti-sigma B factor antagonist
VDEALSIEPAGDGTLVIKGELDIASAPDLTAALPPPSSEVVLDLSGVTFIDSSGLRALLGAEKRATEAGGSLVLRDLAAPVQRLLELTGTDRLFTIK